MTEIILKKGLRRTNVLLYDDIEQMPIERFNKINKYWMLHDNIGSSIGDFDKNHYSKFLVLVEEKEKILKQLENFRILVYNIMSEVNVHHLSFACMIHSVNGEEVKDLSEENLKRLLKRLSDLGLTEETLKKKQPKQGRRYLRIWKRISQTSSRES